MIATFLNASADSLLINIDWLPIVLRVIELILLIPNDYITNFCGNQYEILALAIFFVNDFFLIMKSRKQFKIKGASCTKKISAILLEFVITYTGSRVLGEKFGSYFALGIGNEPTSSQL